MNWYYASGRKPEVWHGPCESREEAINMGRNSALGPFSICQAEHQTWSVPGGESFFESFCLDNEELGDPDGDGFGTDISPTPEQYRDLSSALHSVFTSWMDRHGFKPDVWAFKVPLQYEEYFEC